MDLRLRLRLSLRLFLRLRLLFLRLCFRNRIFEIHPKQIAQGFLIRCLYGKPESRHIRYKQRNGKNQNYDQ